MNSINEDSLVDLYFQLRWKSQQAIHTDCYQASRVNVWRDILPPTVKEELMGLQPGDNIERNLPSGSAVPQFDGHKLKKIKRKQFDPQLVGLSAMRPRVGRFYPKGVLQDMAGIFRQNMSPFRCVGLNNGHMAVDFNHPLAGKHLRLSTIIGNLESKTCERGGTCIDLMETITEGPGMQARWQNQPSDYLSDDAFDRDDERPDSHFYQRPRLVQHIDDSAIEMVKNTYGRFLRDNMQVLDLMSSWQSHIPANLHLKSLVGLGLNEKELKKNPSLTKVVVQDLNAHPQLPFEAEQFDVVVSTASIEYLIDPVTIFREVSRVLRFDGHFVITFSNRWFPTKAIRIWQNIHEFERMGLVLEYFSRSNAFKNLQTYSIRGLPRPYDDKYFPELRFSDPIFAVWGQKEATI
jgi:FKBP-type peptidyl-prolyl cis-trans isomerase 2/SAM-dependent methyltransferase